MEADTTPAFAADASIAARNYIAGRAITPLTLPQATGGNGDIMYALSPPAGLTFNPGTRVLSGTPLTAAAVTEYTYTVTDEDSDTDTLTFRVTVEADTAPTFGGVAMPDQLYVVNLPMPPLTLPAATGGNGAITYALTPALPAGLTFNAATRVLIGTPQALTSTEIFTYTASDSDPNEEDSDEDTLTFSITVGADIAPAFAAFLFIPFQTYIVGEAVALTLPAVETPGNGATTYTLTPALPAGLTFNAATRVLIGTPQALASTKIFTYTARDSDANNTADDVDPRSIFITVVAEGTDIAPTFGGARRNFDYNFGQPVALTLPVATGGNGPIVYQLFESDEPVADGTSVFGLTYNAAARTLTGTATSRMIVLVWRAFDSDDNNNVRDSGSLDLFITALPDIAPVFGMATVPDQSYIMGTAIPPLTLPQATRGNGPLRYTLTELPAGLTYDEVTRTITGTPTTVQVATTYDYGVVDDDGNNTMADADLRMFTITVVAAGTDIAPTFGGVAIPDQFYAMNLPMPPLTLPAATGGNGAITYALTPALPAGLTFNAATRVLIGTPQALTSTEIFTYTASDSDPNEEDSDEDTLTFSITVGTDIAPAFADGVFMPFQTYIVGESVALTLPVATGGNGPIVYQLFESDEPVADGASVLGLTYNAAARTLTGTVTAGAIFLEWVASDSDANNAADDVDSLRFFIRVEVDIAPAFAVTSIAAQTYRQNAPITPLTLPRAHGNRGNRGNGDITYTLTPAIAGLTLNPTSRVLSGAPTTVTTATMYTYTASDSDANNAADDTATLTFTVTVELTVDTAPTFGGATAPAQTYVVNQLITPVTLPAATGGNAPYTYTLTPALPGGLTFDAAERTITGTPIAAAEAADFTYTASDGDTNTMASDAASLSISITVVAEGTDIALTFGGATAPAQTYVVNHRITPVTLPAVIGGNAPYTYTLTPAIPGLTLDPTSRVLTGTPTTTAGSVVHTYTATDEDDDAVTLTFNITVVADTMPSFGAATIADQTFTTGAAVALTLPTATSGNPPYTYTLTRADGSAANLRGLTFDATATPPTLTGTPTRTLAATAFTYKVTDSDLNNNISDEAELTFRVTVGAQITGFDVSVFNLSIGTVSTVREGSAQFVRVLAIATPCCSDFAADQTITFAFTPPPTRPASASDPFVSYNAIASRTRTIAEGDDRVETSFSLQTAEDAFDHADFPLVITATAQPSGITGTATVTLIDNDISIVTTAATATVAEVATTTYDVQLSEAPPVDTTVTVASQGTGTATVSPATLTFTTTNWNMAQTVTVTGVAMGSTTIRHSAPTASGFGYETNDVAVTVTAADTAPTFGGATAPALTYVVNRLITPVTLPAATGGNGAITYALTPAIPDGLTFDAAERTITGTPNAAAEAADFTYTARDSDDDTDMQTFSITVVAEGTDIAPTFGGATAPAQTYVVNQLITPVTLLAATGGNGAITYALTPALPGGLTFTAAARTITGTPTTVTTATMYTYTARDSDDDTDTLTFSITVEVDIAPTFGGATAPAQTYVVNQLITPVTLPAATGGNGAITYALTPAIAGLTLNATTRVLIGTPQAAHLDGDIHLHGERLGPQRRG